MAGTVSRIRCSLAIDTPSIDSRHIPCERKPMRCLSYPLLDKFDDWKTELLVTQRFVLVDQRALCFVAAVAGFPLSVPMKIAVVSRCVTDETNSGQ